MRKAGVSGTTGASWGARLYKDQNRSRISAGAVFKRSSAAVSAAARRGKASCA